MAETRLKGNPVHLAGDFPQKGMNRIQSYQKLHYLIRKKMQLTALAVAANWICNPSLLQLRMQLAA